LYSCAWWCWAYDESNADEACRKEKIMSMEVLDATEDWISHFNKYKDQMYMTLSQADVLILLNYLRAVEGEIVEMKRDRGDYSL
jgi:hypothetical protein